MRIVFETFITECLQFFWIYDLIGQDIAHHSSCLKSLLSDACRLLFLDVPTYNRLIAKNLRNSGEACWWWPSIPKDHNPAPENSQRQGWTKIDKIDVNWNIRINFSVIKSVATALRDRKADIGDEKYSHKFFKIFKLSLYLHLRNLRFGNHRFATIFNTMRFFDRTEEIGRASCRERV